jgi:hypothetical protein
MVRWISHLDGCIAAQRENALVVPVRFLKIAVYE